jgi:hypothetical protein
MEIPCNELHSRGTYLFWFHRVKICDDEFATVDRQTALSKAHAMARVARWNVMDVARWRYELIERV